MQETNRIYRPATIADAARIAALMRQAAESHASSFYDDDEMSEWLGEMTTEMVQGKLGSSVLIEVCEVDGEVVGIGALGEEPDEIDLVFVESRHAGQGIGTEMMRRLEAFSASAGTKVMWLDASRNAIPLYEKCGYLKSTTSCPKAGRENVCTRMEKVLS